MNLVICGQCGETVEAHPLPPDMVRDSIIGRRLLPAEILVSREPHEFGDVWVTATGVEVPTDPDALRAEGVPLRRNHEDDCPRPKKRPPKRIWTKAGWRTR